MSLSRLLSRWGLLIVFADSQGSPDQAKTVAEQLITQDHVVALLGTVAISPARYLPVRSTSRRIGVRR